MEKIKITINANVFSLLKKDCTDFGITKTDGQINFNAFINTLVANFYQQFSASEEGLVDQVTDAIQDVAERYKQDVMQKVLKILAQQQLKADEGKNVVFAFKPTKVSEKANQYIQQILVSSESLSSFYRRLFTAYAHKPKNEREKIIFEENFALLNKAIKKGVNTLITLKGDVVIKDAAVYHVGSSKDELFNYALIYSKNRNHTIRLSKIQNINLLTSKADIPLDKTQLFDMQIASAIQYPFYNTDMQPVKVQLTQKGKQLFDKIYLYRPTPTQIDGDIYTFTCSGNQLLYYFERFGENALILEPKRLGIFMRNYYYFAYKKYKNVYLKD